MTLNLRGKSSGRVRWLIVWTLFLSTVINYMSRQTFSVLSPLIARQFHFAHRDIGAILSSFQVSYATAWLAGGILLDALGTKAGLVIAAAWWSAVSLLSALASSVPAFAVFRFMLGVGEGFNWPGATKAVAEWFPAKERGVAVAIFDSGSSVGGALAAISIPWIALTAGWRWSFVFTGILGLAWLTLWIFVYYPLDKHPRVTLEETSLIRDGQSPHESAVEPRLRQWPKLLRDSNVWAIVIGRSLTDPIWWFYVFWLPQYLSDARGFSLQRITMFAWIPFVAADAGNFTGGFLADFFVRRGMQVVRARLMVCCISCIPILAGIPAALVQNSYCALALICVALWGYAAWSTMGLTLPADILPQSHVASVTGLSGLAAGLVGAAFTFSVGFLVDRVSYMPAFLAAGILPIIATAAVYRLIRAR